MQNSPSEAPALSRGLSILELVGSSREPVAFGRIVAELTLSKASAARLLRVLCDRGYLAKEAGNGRYLPGPRMNIIRGSAAARQQLVDLAGPILHSLRGVSQNTAALFHQSDGVFELLAKEVHQDSVAMQPVGNLSSGLISPPWGWLLLAGSPRAALTHQTEQYDRHGADMEIAPSDVETFLRERIREAEDKGYAYDAGYTRATLRRLAAPVRNHCGDLTGALVVAGTSLSLPDDAIQRVAGYLTEAGRALSLKLGWKETDA